jgi:arabinofuranosyltransferase
MRGRFLSIPLITAVGLLAHMDVLGRHKLGASAVPIVVFLGLLASPPTVLSSSGHGRAVDLRSYYRTYGIADEREFYFQDTGLLNGKPLADKLGHDMVRLRAEQDLEHKAIELIKTAGRNGFRAGPGPFLIAYWGIGDALLARLPMRDRTWRIGHFTRLIPAGYIDTLIEGENKFRDPRIREYYEYLRPIIRGPLFTRKRWSAILAMNLGRRGRLVRGNDAYETAGNRELRRIEEPINIK